MIYFSYTYTISYLIVFALRPDTATYVQKLERERLAKERGEGKDNRSFLEKYVRLLSDMRPSLICALIN